MRMPLNQLVLACILLPALLLLGTPLRAQQDNPATSIKHRPLELSAGFNGLYRFQQPRLILKRTIGKNILRGSFYINIDSEQHPQILPLQCTSTSSSYSNWTIEPGFGLERRLPLKKNLFFFYGGEVRLNIKQEGIRDRYRESARCFNGIERERRFKYQSWSTGISVYPFVGFRLQANQQFSFSMEIGPSMGYKHRLNKSFRYEILEGTSSDDFELEIEESSDSGKFTFALFTRPFLSIGYTF